KIHIRPSPTANRTSMKQIPLSVILAAALGLSGCAGRMATYTSDPSNVLLDRGKTALCIPLDSLRVTYVDNTTSSPDTLFSDSFFVEAANRLFAYEVSKNFKTCGEASRDESDSLALFPRTGYSRLDRDTVDLQRISGRVHQLADKYNADLVVIPYSLTIRQVTIKPAGWRNDRFGPGYERPVTCTAKTSFHVQIWDRSGRLVYERTGKSNTDRPFLYSLFKREKKPDKDIVKYARRFFAPPLVKALYKAIELAMMVRI
ncbi:MAG TPA: hypothetical protein VKF42_06040, partial [Chitinivibrionales bacterium]|nr:hypothetical protein [Chitinivibrionales bacterium]